MAQALCLACISSVNAGDFHSAAAKFIACVCILQYARNSNPTGRLFGRQRTLGSRRSLQSCGAAARLPAAASMWPRTPWTRRTWSWATHCPRACSTCCVTVWSFRSCAGHVLLVSCKAVQRGMYVAHETLSKDKRAITGIVHAPVKSFASITQAKRLCAAKCCKVSGSKACARHAMSASSKLVLAHTRSIFSMLWSQSSDHMQAASAVRAQAQQRTWARTCHSLWPPQTRPPALPPHQRSWHSQSARAASCP